MTVVLRSEQLSLGLGLRDAALDRMEARYSWVREARAVAVQVCEEYGTVTTDELHAILPEPPHPNCWGSVLRPPLFKRDGMEQTRRPSGHARWIGRWSLLAKAKGASYGEEV